MGKFILFIYCLLGVSCASQQTISIKATPGGVFEVPYNVKDKTFVIIGSGSKLQPFVFKGVDNKSVVSGNSAITVRGSFIEIRNIEFLNNEIDYSSKKKALINLDKRYGTVDNVTITNCKFSYSDKFVDKDVDSQFFWIYINADFIRVNQSSFEGKQNRLPMIHVESKNRRTVINNNFFGNVEPRKGEALEAIRIGLGDGAADCIVASNTFYKYNGDSETISVKADKVRLINNSFNYCRSGISLRGGDNSMVEKNIFSYTKAPLRIAGAGHNLINNVFKGSDDNTHLIFMVGGDNYNQVRSNTFSGNIFYEGLTVALLKYDGYVQMPDQIVFNNNLILSDGEIEQVKDQKLSATFFSNGRSDLKRLSKTLMVSKFNLNKTN